MFGDRFDVDICMFLLFLCQNSKTKQVKERIDAKNAFDSYLHSLTSAVESSLKEKLDDDEKDTITEFEKINIFSFFGVKIVRPYFQNVFQRLILTKM